MNVEVRMRKRCLSLVCVLALLLSLSVENVRASEGETMVDGSYLTHDDESTGEAVLIMRGEDLLSGTCKVSKGGTRIINAGGTTTAAHTVSKVGIAIVVERLKAGTSTWSYYRTWEVEKTNAISATTSKNLTVAGGYYYRVRATHWANSDVSSSFTNGVYIN